MASGSIMMQLTGGLGNQLFQYAAGRTLTDRLGCELVLDIRSSRLLTTRSYELSRFGGIQVETFDGDPVTRNGGRGAVGTWRGLSQKIMGRNPLDAPAPYASYRSPVTSYDPGLLTLTAQTWVSGYFQSEKTFLGRSSRLRSELRLPDTGPRPAEGSAVLHVRRGDFTSRRQRETHPVLPVEYYLAAREEFRRQGIADTFYLVSDDMPWATAMLAASDTFPAPTAGGTTFDDFAFMSRAGAHVIANSTFSWWAAWLADSPHVICPKRWFGGSLSEVHIAPDRWTRR